MSGYAYQNPATGSYTVFVPKDAKTGSFRKPVSAVPTAEQIAEITSAIGPGFDPWNAAKAIAALYPTCQPSRERVEEAIYDARTEDGCGFDDDKAVDAVLALLPGRPEAEVKAEALEEFADTIEPPLGVPTELRRERYVRQEVRTEALHAAAALRGER